MDNQPNLAPIQFLIFFHLQATSSETEEIKPCQETIEISAKAVSFKAIHPVHIDEFHRFVRPQCNPKLTPFCQDKTGIKSHTLKTSKHIQEIVTQFENWIKSIPEINTNNYVFVTWGNWAISSGLLKQLRVKKLKNPEFINSFTDLKRVVKRKYKDVKNLYDVANILKMNIDNSKNLTKSQSKVNLLAEVGIKLYEQKIYRLSRKNVSIITEIVSINSKQDLEYLLVLDFEATCQQGVKLKPCSQIIQFPVIVVCLKTKKLIAQFHHYVTPKFNPKLTKFCTELTGITQQMVDNKLILQEVLVSLDEWIQNQQYLQANNFTFVTCGDWDLTNCLKNEIKAKNIVIEDYLKNYINIKQVFTRCMNQFHKSQGMMGMLKALNIPHEGKHHSGIDDVKNICKVCIGLIQMKGLKFTKKMIKYVK